MLAILGALTEEIAGIRKQMVIEEASAHEACNTYQGKYRGKDALLVRTGMGKAKAEIAARFVLEKYPVTALVSLGFAGALNRDLRVGDVVLCSTLHCVDGHIEDVKPEVISSDASLLSLASRAAEKAGAKFCCKAGVTSPVVVTSPELKQELGEASGAYIVDMESYWIARIAAEKHVPFIAVRAISDDVHDSLPVLVSKDGRWRRKKALPYFATHPMQAFSLYRKAQRARKSLTAFASYIVEVVS